MENEKNLHVSVSATEAQDIARTFRINSPPIVFRLPTETLQAIFIRCASDYNGEDRGFSTRTPPRWVNISYVCRHWRSVALNCPILWTFLFFVSTRWMEELLSRSKQAPLKLHLAERIPLAGETPLVRALTSLEQVANHAERIQELELSLDCVPSKQLFSKLFLHAPLLQKVKLSVGLFDTEQDWPRSTVLNTPALHALEVLRSPIPWDSFTLSGVRFLSLRYFHSQETTGQFLASLSCMQDLEHLYLDCVLPSATGFLTSSAFTTFHKINLPYLSRLLITDSLSMIITLFSCINIPLKTEIRLLYSSNPPDDDAVLSPLFAQRFGMSEDSDHALSPTIHSLSINFEDHEPGEAMMSVSFSSHHDHPHCYSLKSWEDGIPLQIVTDLFESMTDNGNRIMTILRSIPLTDVYSIRVCRPPWSSRFWRELLGHFPNLRRLELSDGHLPDIAPALSFTPTTNDGEEHFDRACAQDQMLVPKLETLSLFCIMFGEKWMVSNDDDDASEELVADIETLLDALATRTESPGQLTTTLCPRSVVGRWGGGHFNIGSDDE